MGHRNGVRAAAWIVAALWLFLVQASGAQAPGESVYYTHLFGYLTGRSRATGQVVLPFLNLWDQPIKAAEGARIINRVPHGTRVQILEVRNIDRTIYYRVNPPEGTGGWILSFLVRWQPDEVVPGHPGPSGNP